MWNITFIWMLLSSPLLSIVFLCSFLLLLYLSTGITKNHSCTLTRWPLTPLTPSVCVLRLQYKQGKRLFFSGNPYIRTYCNFCAHKKETEWLAIPDLKPLLGLIKRDTPSCLCLCFKMSLNSFTLSSAGVTLVLHYAAGLPDSLPI